MEIINNRVTNDIYDTVDYIISIIIVIQFICYNIYKMPSCVNYVLLKIGNHNSYEMCVLFLLLIYVRRIHWCTAMILIHVYEPCFKFLVKYLHNLTLFPSFAVLKLQHINEDATFVMQLVVGVREIHIYVCMSDNIPRKFMWT